MTEQKGLYEKYMVIEYETKKILFGCFVLEPLKDPVALEALRTYARETPNLELRRDLEDWIDKIEGGFPLIA